MTDIFFSYSSADRERVRPIRDALVAQGFEVFWDQQVPAGMDWDTWIRQHLTKSKCAMAFWSATSVLSDNVRHEAMVAKQQGKLISVLLEPLTAEQFPMGLYAQQAANLSGWSGDYDNEQWRKFRREFEAKLTPLWVRRQIDELEAELVGERARREGAERRDRVLQAQIAKEAEAQQDLKRERDKAFDEVAALKTTVEELNQARADVKAKDAKAQQAFTRDRNKALDEVAALKSTVEELTQVRADAEARVLDLSQRLRNVRKSKVQEIARSIGAALPPFVIAAAVATLGFWSYQLIWSAPPPLLAVTTDSTPEVEQQRLAAIKEEEQAKAAAVEAKLNAAEAEQQRLKEEVQLLTKAGADAEAKRKAEAEQQPLFAIIANSEASGSTANYSGNVFSRTACEEGCARDSNCKVFTYNKSSQMCFRYAMADFKPDERYDSGVRIQQTNPSLDIKVAAPASPVVSVSPTGPFTLRTNTEATGYPPEYSSWYAASIATCEERCTREPRCKIFSYNKISGMCFRYAKADFKSNEKFDTGVRIEQPK